MRRTRDCHDYLHRRRTEQTGYGTESYQYDLAGNPIWKEDRLDQITRYDRDGLGRTWRERWKDAGGTTIRTMTYTFDNFSRLTGVTDPTANYTYVYDALSRVTQITHDPDGMTPNVVVNQAYDASSNRTQMKAAVGAANDFVNDYTLDALNRITAVTQQSQAGGNAVAAKRANLAYDASDRLTYVWRYSSVDTSEYVGRAKYISYDKAGRLTDMKYDGGGITTIDYDIRYADHLLDYVTITTSAAVTINYNYDTVDQVNNLDYTGTGMPADVTYGYDDSGNRTGGGYSTGTFNRLTSDGTYNYQYDANGNPTLRTKISDNTKTEYTWDHRNRLTGVKFKTAGGTVTKELQYSYDVYNRLVRRRLDADGAGAGGFTDKFWIYDGDNPILEFASGTATAPSHRYLWGPAVDQLLADEQVATGSPNDVRWPMTDWQGTVRDVATYNASTNVTTIANHKIYEAFGKVHSETSSTVDTAFGYTGRYFDDDAGLQWNLNRWYDPLVGRWLSEDPIGFAAGDPNLYRYVGNSVGAYTDPSGLEPPLTAGAVHDGAAGFWWDQPQADRDTRDAAQGALDAQAAAWQQRLLNTAAERGQQAARVAIQVGWETTKESIPPLKTMVDCAETAYYTGQRAFRVAQNARAAGYGPVGTAYQTCGVIAGDYTGVTNFSYMLPGSNADVVTGERMSDAECWVRGGIGTVQLGMTGYMFGRPLRPVPKTFVEQMSECEATRYRAYWAQDYNPVNSTRQRLYTTPGTRSIVDQKLSHTGEVYARETIYDQFGRRIGTNDFTAHGRPTQHTNPHYHPNPWNNPSQHGPTLPGLHPETPQ